MGRVENVAIFEDTKNLCETNAYLKEGTEKSIHNQKIILGKEMLPELKYNRYSSTANIVVSKNRTYQAAAMYKENKIAVHNFASATNPGGGVTRGANAQEECLCRCSNLYFCLNTSEAWEKFYKPHRKAADALHNDDIIYTPEVQVFKTDTKNPVLMEQVDWYTVDMITCAAPNLREKPSNAYNSYDGSSRVMISEEELLKLHEKRLRRILDVAVMEQNDTVILGAFGCGAFQNKAEIVAQAAKNVVNDYKNAFKGTDRAYFVDRREFGGPIQEQIEAAFQYVLEKINLGMQIKGIYRQDVYELPTDSVRELIANAVVHRSYLEPGNIQVALFDDRLEVTSPGMLLNNVSIKKMMEGYYKPRNPAIARVFAYMKIIEKWGTGIPRIFRECREYGLPEPELIDFDGDFRVNIYRKNSEQQHRVTEKVTEKEEKVLALLLDNPEITMMQLAEKLEISRKTVAIRLKSLKEKGVILRIGSDRKGYWKVV